MIDNDERRDQGEEQKQDAEKPGAASGEGREGYSAGELADAASYENETEIAQKMRRGDESKGDPDERDAAGTAASDRVSPDVSPDKDERWTTFNDKDDK